MGGKAFWFNARRRGPGRLAGRGVRPRAAAWSRCWSRSPAPDSGPGTGTGAVPGFGTGADRRPALGGAVAVVVVVAVPGPAFGGRAAAGGECSRAGGRREWGRRGYPERLDFELCSTLSHALTLDACATRA